MSALLGWYETAKQFRQFGYASGGGVVKRQMM